MATVVLKMLYHCMISIQALLILAEQDQHCRFLEPSGKLGAIPIDCGLSLADVEVHQFDNPVFLGPEEELEYYHDFS